MKKELSTTTLKITPRTAEVFRKYARHLGKQQSETLQLMLDFFENNGLSPMENMGPKIITLEKRLKIRINSMVAILRDIEKTQTKPTQAMLQLLFQGKPSENREILLEKNLGVQEQEVSPGENLTSTSDLILENKLTETQQDLKTVLEKVEVVNSGFGRKYLRLNMSGAEFKALKYKLKSTQ